MTLDELTDYVTSKTQLIGDNDVAFAKSALSKRYELIYNSYLWKDSLVMVTVVTDPNNVDNAAGVVLLPQQINRVVAIRDGSNNRGVMVEALETFYQDNYDTFLNSTGANQWGVRQKFAPLSNIWLVARQTSLTIQSSSSADTSPVKVVWRDQTERHIVTLPLPITLTPTDGSSYIEVESVFKPVTTGTVSAVNPDLTVAGTIAPADKRSASYQRVFITPVTTTAQTLYVLGKKPFIPLDFGSETPAIKNLDNCLIAFACADLLQRNRQYAKMQTQMQEGGILLGELAKLETLQEATHQVFQPATGAGTEICSRQTWGWY